MPEIAEVARITHFLQKHLVGLTIGSVVAQDDPVVYGKAGTTGEAFRDALKGRNVVSAGSQGKYFWITLDKPPHPVMHFGMTGWIHIRGERTAYTNYYKKQKPADVDQWPPRFWKFLLETVNRGGEKVEVAFTDPRRFGRIRLVDCPGHEIRKHSPLIENGPDPVNDLHVFTYDFLATKMRAKRVPIKSFLLDQTVISGIGNWVGDEVLFQAKIHPEQYSNEFDYFQTRALYDAIRNVCEEAVGVLGDSDMFPKNWLFHHRWEKGNKTSAGALPSGEKLSFVTVGGRTSCFCPSLQKKGNGVKDEKVEGPTVATTSVPAPKAKSKRSRKEESPVDEDVIDPDMPTSKRRRVKKASTTRKEEETIIKVVKEEGEEAVIVKAEPLVVPVKRKGNLGKAAQTKKVIPDEKPGSDTGRRRSLRLSKS